MRVIIDKEFIMMNNEHVDDLCHGNIMGLTERAGTTSRHNEPAQHNSDPLIHDKVKLRRAKAKSMKSSVMPFKLLGMRF